MTDTTSATRTSAAPLPAVASIYRMFLRGQLTRLRALGLLLLSLIAILLAILARTDEFSPVRTAVEIMAEYGISLVVPVCTLWIASSLTGDLIEDRLMVYLWLKPVPRWVVPTAAVAAAVTIMVPLVVVPLGVAAAISGSGALLVSTVTTSLIGVFAYGAVFVLFGLRFSRALWWGLAYVLVWENAIARLTDGLARLSIRSYLSTLMSRANDVDLALADRSAGASYVVPLVAGVVAIGLAAWVLQTRDID